MMEHKNTSKRRYPKTRMDSLAIQGDFWGTGIGIDDEEEPTQRALDEIIAFEKGLLLEEEVSKETIEEMQKVMDPDGTLREKHLFDDMTFGELTNLYLDMTSPTFEAPVNIQQKSIVENVSQSKTYPFGPFESLVQAKQCYLLETTLANRLSELLAKAKGRHHKQIPGFVNNDVEMQEKIQEAKQKYQTILDKYPYLNLDLRVFREHLRPATIRNVIETAERRKEVAEILHDPTFYEYVVMQSAWNASFKNEKAQVAAGLATYNYYHGQRLEKSPIEGLYLLTKENAVRIASTMIRSMHKEPLSIKEGAKKPEIEYSVLLEEGLNMVRFSDEDGPYYMMLATYHPDEAQLLIDHILVKLVEKEVIAARMLTTQEDRQYINRVYISLTPHYLSKKDNAKHSNELYPAPFTGSFLLK